MVQGHVASISVAVAFVLWRILGKCLRTYFTRKMTVLYDVPNIGCPRSDKERHKGAAVVCGGSVAGLWAARICADHFDEVIIVEPEVWLSTEDGKSNIYNEKGVRFEDRGLRTRTRVPQYRAQHVFQPLALIALRQLFPTFDDEIRGADGRIADAEYNLQIFGRMIRLPDIVYPSASYSQVFFVTRETYERTLRGLVLAYSSRIRWVAGTATGVTPDEDPTLLASVTVRAETGSEKIIPASLVIDCTGGSQAGLKWLKRIYSDPKYSILLQRHNTVPRGALSFDEDLKIEYNTMQRYRKFRIFVPPDMRSRLPLPNGYDNTAWIYTYMPRPGLERKMFMIDRMEGHRIEWAFGGWGDPPLPEDFSEVKDWLRNMETDKPIPDWIYELVDVLLELNDVQENELGRYPNCSWIRFELAPYIPSNFVAIGDAVMRVNPTFGQGCSKAAIGAITLDSLLRKPSLLKSESVPAGFGRTFFKVHSDKIAGTWDGTKPTDYQWDTTIPVKGEKLSDERITGGIVSILMQLGGTDDGVNSALWHVRTFLAPPTDLLHPLILAKVQVQEVLKPYPTELLTMEVLYM